MPGMILFLHAILIDRPAGFAMSAGHTVLVTNSGCEILSRVPVEYEVCRGSSWTVRSI